MMTYSTFKKYISKLNSVSSITGKAQYDNISVKGDVVSFVRSGKTDKEEISIKEMYNFFCSEQIADINTSIAKNYISGRVQSPAVAIIHAVFKKSYGDDTSFWGGLKRDWLYSSWKERFNMFAGLYAFLLVALFVIAIVWSIIFGTDGDRIDISKTNTECVINKPSFGVYDSDYLDKVVELRKNKDVLTLEQMQEMGIICNLEKEDRCTYIRYFRDGFIVVKPYNKLRPVLIEIDRVSKVK